MGTVDNNKLPNFDIVEVVEENRTIVRAISKSNPDKKIDFKILTKEELEAKRNPAYHFTAS